MRRQTLPITALPAWAKLSGIDFKGVGIQHLTDHGIDKGSAIVAKQDIGGEEEEQQLMIVPKDMILSLEAVERYAKSDQHLREVVEAVGDYAKTARGAVLIFLLMQITNSSPDIAGRIGVSGLWTEYVKFLPETILLPTFWTDREQEVLTGTSLETALDAKLNSLAREFGHLRTSTFTIAWCQRYWWDDETGILTFDDWKLVDAMYRSRALDLPGTGHAMVPCIDMANHASGKGTVALYETDTDGNGILLLRRGMDLAKGDEVTITYGDDKGACEMLFSYGFIEGRMEEAKELFLDLDIPDDDPLKHAKKAASKFAPGFRLFSSGGGTKWEGDFVWLICVNEEDGFTFRVKQSNDGGKELEIRWKDSILEDVAQLKELLSQDRMWEVFQLRAVAILQGRVEAQLGILNASEEQIQDSRAFGGVSTDVWGKAVKLRELESALLSQAYRDFEQRKNDLIESETVQDYLGAMNAVGADEDFS